MSGPTQLIAFHVDGQRYALEMPVVERVVRAVALAPLPAGPHAVRGVFSLHGEIIPVGDLRRRLGLQDRAVTIDDQIIIARTPTRNLGLLSEGPCEVVSCAAEDIERSESVLQGAETIAGIGRMPDGLILIHDLARFLSAQDERTLNEALDESRIDHAL